MERVKLTPDLDLMKTPETLKEELKKIKKFLEKHKVEWYIQSSFATRIYGVKKRKVTDIDIRVNYPLRKLFSLIKKKYDKRAYLRHNVKYEKGEFRNNCIIIPFGKTHIDIIGELVTYNNEDKKEYKIPFDKYYKKTNFRGLPLPVCSIRYLVIYKLINRRGKNERKNDLEEAKVLLRYINS